MLVNSVSPGALRVKISGWLCVFKLSILFYIIVPSIIKRFQQGKKISD